MLNIVADENMPHVRELFGELGNVQLLPGRAMTPEQISDADVLLVRSVTRVNAALLAKATRLKFVGTATIGTDHIDKALLAERQIAFTSAPGCNRISVGDYVTSALLVLAERHALTLSALSLAVIGAGNTGSDVAAKAAALGMRVLRCDPPRQRREGGEFVSLEEALDADVVSFHVPLTRQGDDATFHLLDAKRIAALRAGQCLINASRGEVWDNQALLQRQQGPLPLSLVMDVWENEPEVLAELVPHTEIATPHIAGYSLEGKARGTWMLYEALCQWLGQPASRRLHTLLPAPDVMSLTLGQQPDQALIGRLVHLVYDVRRDDARFRRELGIAGSFDQQRKCYPERREFSSLQIAGNGPLATLAALGFSLSEPCS